MTKTGEIDHNAISNLFYHITTIISTGEVNMDISKLIEALRCKSSKQITRDCKSCQYCYRSAVQKYIPLQADYVDESGKEFWCSCDIIRILLDSADALESVMTCGWISVKEKLPEMYPVKCEEWSDDFFLRSADVLIAHKSGREDIGFLEQDDDSHPFWSVEDNTIEGVTHWMPLPDLPEELK